MRIGVAGIAGRMGRLVAEEIVAAGAGLAGGTARAGWTARAERAASVRLFATPLELAGECDVLVDFTRPDTLERHAEAVEEAGCAWVLGTTGLDGEGEARLRLAASRVAIVRAANFSPGVNLVLALARRLAAALPGAEYDAEIVEMHHRQKVDAPSGTALALAQAVAAGRGVPFADVLQPPRQGQTGARPPGAIGIASLRGGQVVGEHSLVFAGAGEHITLAHSALDRRVFATGAVRAALWAGQDRPPGLYGMMDVLGMSDDS